MHRRSFLGSLLAYNAFLLDARSQGTSRAPRLKIREIRAVRMRDINPRFVRVYTDQGLTGTGETLDTIGAEDIINRHLGPGLAGRDPLDIEGIWYDLWTWKQVPGGIPPVFMRGMGGPYLAAMSGIEMALWDLAGKAMGVPLYRLFGGRMRNKVAVYFHSGNPKHASDLVRSSGVRGIKTGLDSITGQNNDKKGYDPGKNWNYTLTNPQIDELAQHTAAMREALGPEVALMLECHTRYDTESAIQIAKAVEPYRPTWLEEPVPADNPEAMAKVRQATRIPIATGENIYTRWGFLPYLEKQAASIIQPDMAKAGGLWEGRKIAAMAEVYHIPIAPHGVATTLGKVAYAHVCATVPNFMILEWAHFGSKPIDALTTPANYKAGFVELSEAPGIGVEVNVDAVKERLEPGIQAL
ncbi:MAG: mandelate racemase/muconate lactonizing enzyme family protein [Bryobacterales bacterium]|nr:mandelate racemase/muconate lactonizing enzyme family protein [Bryobacterales bacterium]